MKYSILLLAASLFTGGQVFSQDVDLDKILAEKEAQKPVEKYVIHTFPSTRLVNGSTIENLRKGILDFRVSHRFGTLNQGIDELFGLDNATMRMGVDYAISDRFMVGVGRSTFEKQYDGFFKLQLLKQTIDDKIPVSVSWLSSAMVKTQKTTTKLEFKHRVSYAHQAIIARKFSKAFSLQLMPTMVHYNLVPLATNKNNIFSLGGAARIKVLPNVHLNAEYYFVPDSQKLDGTNNSLSIGFDIETGGHVFQLHLTNSTGMTERTFITETRGKWDKGDIHFGFNISRVFTVKKPKA